MVNVSAFNVSCPTIFNGTLSDVKNIRVAKVSNVMLLASKGGVACNRQNQNKLEVALILARDKG